MNKIWNGETKMECGREEWSCNCENGVSERVLVAKALGLGFMVELNL